jgi:excinuclease ABC subunit B
VIKSLETQMRESADNLDFETAALLRDKIKEINLMSSQKNKKKKN